MDAFATKGQMAARSQGAIPADQPFLEIALQAASRVIRNHCHWHIAPSAQTREQFRPARRTEIWLRSVHVTGILSFITDGAVIPPAALDWYENGLIEQATTGRVEVLYQHGYAEVPEDLVDLSLQIAARALGSPLGVVREQTLMSSVTWTTTAAGVAGGTVLMEHEQNLLTEYVVGYLP